MCTQCLPFPHNYTITIISLDQYVSNQYPRMVLQENRLQYSNLLGSTHVYQ